MTVDYDPFSEAVYRDPYPIYKQLRDESPIHYIEKYRCWFLSRFADIWREEQDHENYTIEQGQMPNQVMTLPIADELATAMEEQGELAQSIAGIDPPRHTELRRQIAPLFRPAVARSLEDRTRELTRSFISEWEKSGECDAIADYAMRTSVRIACTIAGLPLEMCDWFVERVNLMFERDETGMTMTPRAMEKVGELMMWLAEHVAEKRRSPDAEPNALNALFSATINGKLLSDVDVLGNLSLMLVGGTETLPKAFSSCVYRLWQHPDQRAEVARDPSLLPGTFREALRYDMPTQALGRKMKRDKEVDGHQLREGDGVLFMWASANRDEREFPDAERFDIHRNAPRILTFGSGSHMCLGTHIAQMEGRIMLEELLRVAPEYEVVEEKTVRIRSEVFRGFSSLPIRFKPRD